VNKIEFTLLEMGAPANQLGFKYLCDGVQLALDDPEYLREMTGRLYPEVAKINGTTPPGAERNMRHAIETAFQRCDPEVIYKYFGNSIDPDKCKPTNSEFIATVALALRDMEKV